MVPKWYGGSKGNNIRIYHTQVLRLVQNFHVLGLLGPGPAPHGLDLGPGLAYQRLGLGPGLDYLRAGLVLVHLRASLVYLNVDLDLLGPQVCWWTQLGILWGLF